MSEQGFLDECQQGSSDRQGPTPPRSRRALLVKLSVLALLFAILYVVNALVPLALLLPGPVRKAFFDIGLVGKTKRYYYESGRLRKIERWYPQRVGLIYGTLYSHRGTWISKSPDGKTTFRLQYPDATGEWMEWRDDGTKRSHYSMKDGIMDGIHTVWYRNGVKMYETESGHGPTAGSYAKWYPTGQKKREYRVLRRPKKGMELSDVAWFANGKLRFVKYHVDDKPVGTWESWKPDGSRSSRLAFPGGTGRWVTWNEQGAREEQGQFLNGRKHGEWILRYPYEHPRAESYDDGDRLESRLLFESLPGSHSRQGRR